MAKYKRYSGEFLSRKNVTYRAEIWQENTNEYATVGELEFDSESPLTIEWRKEDKEKVILGASATLNIVSPGDRTYEDLYSIEVGQIRLDVYKNGILYWSGCLDPEFYEEPYESKLGYTVALTFSDFGLLDRVKYDLTGMQTFRAIVEYALAKMAINYTSINTSLVSTVFANNAVITGGALSIRSDNFIDEDGEAATMQDVIEGILQPLALRIIQRNGIIYIYDLHSLYNGAGKVDIVWDGDSQTLGVDKVANNVVISFSPYSDSELINNELIQYNALYDTDHYNLTSDAPIGVYDTYGEYYSYYPDYSDSHKVGGSWDYRLIDFTLFISTNATGLAALGDVGTKYFHLLPMLGGATECSGVAYAFRTGGHGGINTGWPQWKCHSGVPDLQTAQFVFKTNRIFLPKLSAPNNYRVRVMQEMLLDSRYNPFSGSTEDNDDGNDNDLKVWSGWVFIPASITLYNASGTALYHYKNKTIAQGAVKGAITIAVGTWEAGADPGDDCFFEYYNTQDLAEDSGIRGWKGNRQCIGRPDGMGGRISTQIYDSFKQMDDGEYLPYPPAAGYLEIVVKAGVRGFNYKELVSSWDATDTVWKNNLRGKLRWNLYKSPIVEVVKNNLTFDEAELEDVEYSGYINAAAKDKISIDTICGTAQIACPTAKGIIFQTSTGTQIQQLKRAGVTDHPEKLLIGTIYSQYASRKTTLSGEANIDPGLHYYKDDNQGNKRFLLQQDIQNLIADNTDARYVEFSADSYDDNNG